MERYDLLRAWMTDNSVTMAWAARKLGMTAPGVSRLLRSERMPVKRHEELVALGFPGHLLPKAEDYKHPGRKPMVPVWEQTNPAAL